MDASGKRRATAPIACWTLLLIAGLPTLGSAESAPRAVHQHAELQQLADDRYWQTLLRYEPRVFRPGRTGSVVAEDFYLSDRGDRDPGAELHAVLDALYTDPEAFDDPDDHPGCRFPARRAWLVEQLFHGDDAVDAERPPEPECPAYDDWRDEIDPEQVVLVFADAYMGNPASMFGHTLLRLDSEARRDTPLASWAVNHAAATDEESGLNFAVQGVFGGYPGLYAAMPYYDKVNEYNHLEDRDLWEYTLDLDKARIERMMAHLYELDEAPAPYYFLYQNCSLRLLMLLEAADPDLRLVDEFRFWALPTDTVRAVTRVDGLVRDVAYRPAAGTRLRHAVDGLASSEAELARRLGRAELAADTAELDDLASERRARVLETAYAYMDHLARQGEIGDEARGGRHQLLVARSRVDSDPPADPPKPEIRPDEGHDTSRVGLGGGALDGVGYGAVEGRVAYHDLADPGGGYLRGSEIALLDTRIRYYEDETPRRAPEARDGLELERLSLVRVRSIQPRTALFRPWSWSAQLGAQQFRNPSGSRSLMGLAQASFGGAWSPGAGGYGASPWVVHAAADAELRSSGRLDDNVRVGAGGRAEMLFEGERLRGRFKARALQFQDDAGPGSDDDGRAWQLMAEAGVALGRDYGVRVRLQREEDFDVRADQAELLLHRYF